MLFYVWLSSLFPFLHKSSWSNSFFCSWSHHFFLHLDDLKHGLQVMAFSDLAAPTTKFLVLCISQISVKTFLLLRLPLFPFPISMSYFHLDILDVTRFNLIFKSWRMFLTCSSCICSPVCLGFSTAWVLHVLPNDKE